MRGLGWTGEVSVRLLTNMGAYCYYSEEEVRTVETLGIVLGRTRETTTAGTTGMPNMEVLRLEQLNRWGQHQSEEPARLVFHERNTRVRKGGEGWICWRCMNERQNNGWAC